MEPASVSSDLISQLAAMPLAERLLLIANDVGSRTDKFAAVPCHELAELLGVPGAEHPNSSEWSFTRYVQRRPVELILEDEDMSPEDIMALTHEERERIQDDDAQEDMDEFGSQTVIAHYTVAAPDDRELKFEAFIEDDGHCIGLLGPYDYRDGRFRDLSDCLTDSWYCW